MARQHVDPARNKFGNFSRIFREKSRTVLGPFEGSSPLVVHYIGQHLSGGKTTAGADGMGQMGVRCLRILSVSVCRLSGEPWAHAQDAPAAVQMLPAIVGTLTRPGVKRGRDQNASRPFGPCRGFRYIRRRHRPAPERIPTRCRPASRRFLRETSNERKSLNITDANKDDRRGPPTITSARGGTGHDETGKNCAA
jgi:hypothetical protein